jgi:hypothetical protein
MYGEWRKSRHKIFVTPETEIPPMPSKVLDPPDDSAYHKSQVEIDEKIDALNDKIRELSERFNEKLQ